MKGIFKKSMLRPVCLLAGLLMFFALAAITNGMAGENYKSTIDEVELTGKLTSEAFKNAKGRVDREIILNLFTPVNVDKDENSGPTKNVSRIQLGLFNGRIKSRVRKLINRKVRIKGILFYGNKPAYHTVILMDVKDVARARK